MPPGSIPIPNDLYDEWLALPVPLEPEDRRFVVERARPEQFEAIYDCVDAAFGKKRDRDVSISSGRPLITGSLDKEIIRRIVREHQGEIRYCYTRELTRNTGLGGKIIMKWVISGSGKVVKASVAENQMGSNAVGSCLASRIKRWRFPKPKGGGIVVVSYPFVFKRGG